MTSASTPGRDGPALGTPDFWRIELYLWRSRNHGSGTAPLGRYARRPGDRRDHRADVREPRTDAGHGGRDRGAARPASQALDREPSDSASRRVELLHHAPIIDLMAYMYLDATFVDAPSRCRRRASGATTSTSRCPHSTCTMPLRLEQPAILIPVRHSDSKSCSSTQPRRRGARLVRRGFGFTKYTMNRQCLRLV